MLYNFLLTYGFQYGQSTSGYDSFVNFISTMLAGMTIMSLILVCSPIIILIIDLVIRIVVGCITADIAKEKGYSGFGFFLYSFAIWPIGLGVAILAQPKEKLKVVVAPTPQQIMNGKIAYYEQLYREGKISEIEFYRRKDEILMQQYI